MSVPISPFKDGNSIPKSLKGMTSHVITSIGKSMRGKGRPTTVKPPLPVKYPIYRIHMSSRLEDRRYRAHA